MKENSKRKIDSQSQSQRQVGFMDSLARVKLQVESECFSVRDREQANELCYIIAEMKMLPKTSPVQIGGNKLPAGSVAEVYSCLRGEHLQYVIDEFKKIGYEIKHKKSYLRSMLYNSVFEHSSAAINDVSINNTG